MEPHAPMFLNTLNKVFDDKRIMVSVIWVWLIVVLIVFGEMVRIDPPQSRKLYFTRPFILTVCMLSTRLYRPATHKPVAYKSHP
jgi:hypothetical protein